MPWAPDSSCHRSTISWSCEFSQPKPFPGVGLFLLPVTALGKAESWENIPWPEKEVQLVSYSQTNHSIAESAKFDPSEAPAFSRFACF